MQPTVDITFRGMSPSQTVEAAVSLWVERLARTCDRIQHCHVWIELPHHHQQRGAHFDVRVVLSIPGGELVVSHDPGRSSKHGDVYLAIADAFLAARRRLHDHARIRRGEVKNHAA